MFNNDDLLRKSEYDRGRRKDREDAEKREQGLQRAQGESDRLQRQTQDQLSTLGGAMDVGFAELSGSIERQTEVLDQIRNHLKEARQTEAAELFELASKSLSMGNLEDAREDFQQARNLNKTAWAPYIGLALVAQRQGDPSTAREWLREGLGRADGTTMDSGRRRPVAAVILHMLARLEAEQGDYAQAGSYLDEMIGGEQVYAFDSQRERAHYYVLDGELDAAVEFLRAMFRHAPADFQRLTRDPVLDPIRPIMDRMIGEVLERERSDIHTLLMRARPLLTALHPLATAVREVRERTAKLREERLECATAEGKYWNALASADHLDRLLVRDDLAAVLKWRTHDLEGDLGALSREKLEAERRDWIAAWRKAVRRDARMTANRRAGLALRLALGVALVGMLGSCFGVYPDDSDAMDAAPPPGSGGTTAQEVAPVPLDPGEAPFTDVQLGRMLVRLVVDRPLPTGPEAGEEFPSKAVDASANVLLQLATPGGWSSDGPQGILWGAQVEVLENPNVPDSLRRFFASVDPDEARSRAAAADHQLDIASVRAIERLVDRLEYQAARNPSWGRNNPHLEAITDELESQVRTLRGRVR